MLYILYKKSWYNVSHFTMILDVYRLFLWINVVSSMTLTDVIIIIQQVQIVHLTNSVKYVTS